MQHRSAIILIGILCLCLLVSSCGTGNPAQAPASSTSPTVQASQASDDGDTDDTAAESAAPSATPSPAPATFAEDTLIAGVDVGDLDEAAAAEKLEEELADLLEPLELRAGADRLTLEPADIDLELAIDAMLAEADRDQRQNGRDEPVEVPLQIDFDEAALRQHLEDFLPEQTASSDIQLLISETDPISRSFAYVPAQGFDLDAAVEQVAERLTSLSASSRTVRLERQTATDTSIPHVSQEVLQQEIDALADEWEGIVGLYLYDLESGETITRNADTVFSAASVIKVGILLFASVSMPSFDEETQEAINAMIIDSDNLKANDVLAFSVGGEGTDAAYTGVLSMTDMLADLGFHHTYMYMPFEAYDYLVGLRGLTIQQGPPQEGAPPYTRPDTILRTTPAEISRLFLMIEDCSQGEGELLDRYPEQLTAARCQEMLDLLARNADTERIVAGIPDDDIRVEHKSGWTQFMHADVGIVRSPGGDYLLAIYLWRDVDELPDVWANPYIVALSRLVYTAYHPVQLEATEN